MATTPIEKTNLLVQRLRSMSAEERDHISYQNVERTVVEHKEQHLPHEAWHVFKQSAGRVQSTMQMKSLNAINDDASLELEADALGAKAILGTPNKPNG